MENNGIFEELRKSRKIIGDLDAGFDPVLTLFVGLYNASKYLDSIMHEIVTQTHKDVFIVIVDNNSEDDTWERVGEFLEILPGRVVICRNKFNMGGLGSLLLNIDLVRTEWFSLIHQDDIYMSHHFETIVRAIKSSDEDVITVSTSMASIDSEGKILGRSIRSQWLIKDFNQPNMFLANMRAQTVPWPSTAFKTEPFNAVKGYWTSSAFSDTEMTLLLSAHGKFRFIDQETMFYRENPHSESHLVTTDDREMTTFLSLARVFNSQEFTEILRMVEREDRDKFIRELDKGIENRLTSTFALLAVKTMSHEILSKEWGFSNVAVVESLKIDYTQFASNQSVELLQRVLDYLEYFERDRNIMKLSRSGTNKHDESATENGSGVGRSLVRTFYFRYGGVVPFRIAKFSLVKFYRIKIRFSRNNRHKYFE